MALVVLRTYRVDDSVFERIDVDGIMTAPEKPKSAPNIIQLFEQFTAIARDFAGPIAAYFKSLVVAGFTREEALALTIAYQTSVLASWGLAAK